MTAPVISNISKRVISGARTVHHNLSSPVLYEHMVRKGEGKLLEGGTFAVRSGERTGRSPQDKFMIKAPDISEHVWWGKHNQPLDEATFDRIVEKVEKHFADRDVYVQDCYVSQDPEYRRTVRVVAEQAYHSLFARTMFVPREKLDDDQQDPGLTILHAPSLELEGLADGVNSDACVLLHMGRRMIVIAGTAYAGEMKKSVFTAMNYYLPLEGVLSLHSAANIDPRTGKTALFFGLSGTGKTTLSTDRERLLIGDDEHGWTQQGIFNIEGGCYAKVIRLREEAEPDIFEMTHEFGTILENVVFDEDTREPDLDDDTVTENTRGSYPLTSLGNVWDGEVAPHPSHVILLTADAFGVMPPVARLSTAQALYHFLSGYTSKLAGTEVGLTEPEATFSSCYGAPFMALNPTVYADLLAERLDATGAEVWLINTGWVGGGYGIGERIAIKETRKMVRAVLNGTLDGVEMRHDPVFGFDVPTSCPGVDSRLLNPREMWPDQAAYDEVYTNLADKFSKNFEQFRPLVTQAVTEAGP